MTFDMKTIEDLSLNAWPSHQMQVYDGWLLRFSYFYTHRTNSVEQIGSSSVPLEDKIQYCEHVYEHWHTPTIFKITPFTNPMLPVLLKEQGYHEEHKTDVMACELQDHYYIEEIQPGVLKMEDQISQTWIDGLFSLKNTADVIHRKIVPSMYAAIPKDVIAISILEENEVVATGLGILDRDYIGIYAIHVKESCRHHGYASAMLRTLLNEGRKKGATKAYLQVVAGNEPATALYKKNGFTKVYDYYFLVKESKK